MIDFNQIVGPLQEVILAWVATYELTVPVKDLSTLNNAEFFISMLGRVKHFSFVEPTTYQSYENLSLGERIGRMKNVGRSMVRFWKDELMVEMGHLRLNYVQMCLQNKEELLRLIIVFMGIIARNEEIRGELDHYIEQSGQVNAGLLNIMIDYAARIGQQEQEVTDSPVKKHKRLITKLEIVEEQLQFYEEYAHSLQSKLEGLQQEHQRQTIKATQSEKRGKEMIKRIEQLELVHEELLKELHEKERKEEFLNEKLANNRLMAEDVVNRLLKQVQKEKQETIFYKNQLSKYENMEAINKELLQSNEELQKTIEGLRNKLNKTSFMLSTKQEQIIILKNQSQSLILQNEGLKLKIDLMEKSYTQNPTLNYSPQQKSITYHDRLSRSFLGESQTDPIFNYQNHLQERQERNDLNDSLTMTIRSSQSNYLQDSRISAKGVSRACTASRGKENVNSFNIVAEVENPKGCLEEINEEKSLDLNMEEIEEFMRGKQDKQMQMELLLQIIFDVYKNMEFLKKQLKKYQQKESLQAKRKKMFLNKVDKVFLPKA